MKKLISILLTLIIIGTMAVSVFAADTYSLKILANGKESTAIPPGGKVSVTLQLSKAKAESIDLYSFQDYICFDPDYLRFVSGSIRIYESEGLVLKNTAASAIKFSASPIDYENRIYINRADTDSVTIPGKTVILTFQLQAQKEGTTKITHDTIEIFRNVGNLESVSSSDATVVISKNAVAKYPVNVPSELDGGKVMSNKTEAAEKENVTLTVTPNSGKQISKVTIKDDSGKPVSATNNGDGTYTFSMPASGVTVNVTFKAVQQTKYSITVNSGNNGTAKASATLAAKGEKITITATPDKRYEIDKITYTPAGGTSKDITSTKSFTMPSSNVSVDVTFKHKYLIGDVNADGKVDAKDKTILNRYLAGWKDYDQKIIDWDAADVNRDGKVDAKDKVILNRYLAGWKGYDQYFDGTYIYS